MDIHKEREAFELVVANKLQNNLYRSLFFNKEIGWYDCADDAPVDVQVFCHDLNCDWLIWKSAKAQAVPDTYTQIVLVLESVQSKIAKTSFLAMDEENENEVMAVDANELSAYIDKLIEAQEQAND